MRFLSNWLAGFLLFSAFGFALWVGGCFITWTILTPAWEIVRAGVAVGLGLSFFLAVDLEDD